MVLSILLALAAAPAILGTQEAIREGQRKEKREEHRARRCNLTASCVRPSRRSREIDGRQIILKDGKLYIDTGESDEKPFGHPFTGYYLPYPDAGYEGLVTTITNEAPVLNWTYVDRDTYEVKYGVRVDAQENYTGPFDWTQEDRRLTLEGWEGFVAVEELPSLWALYFDRDDNGLRTKVKPGTRVLEIELSRKEKRLTKAEEAARASLAKQNISNGINVTVSRPTADGTNSQAEQEHTMGTSFANIHFGSSHNQREDDDTVSRCNTQGSTIGDDTLASEMLVDNTPASSIQGDDETEAATNLWYGSAAHTESSLRTEPTGTISTIYEESHGVDSPNSVSEERNNMPTILENALNVSEDRKKINRGIGDIKFPFLTSTTRKEPVRPAQTRYRSPTVVDVEDHDT